ncbi:selenocysteine lyase/cysteine desulfurase [Microbacterium endophyticum]|uniref:Selenocysteine lyase/cysteine desulfurase n=1 Tax=Microbacterium endophyticum TaxID=1526412 RepID=A0A7W4YN51_9MICO|nr:aminotransferase class V-fold PLP-dependent enzyme [Microbacterium endophyticum]MBB2975341.1 selenocysteine lyase/cysteine desulfurase [Microbacterium endophyticum]NIK35640.1 selenocysteine lyase/cysteine desulfurase [Microbacterium endophyticum]
MSSHHAADSSARPGFDARLTIDVAHERRLTTGVAHSAHFNSAGSSLPSHAVVQTVVGHLRREEELGGYEAANEVRPRIESVYDSAAQLIGARRHEIALFDSASTGLRVLLDALRLSSVQRIVASTSTYVSHALHLMSIARENGVELVIAPADATRRVDLAALDALLSDGKPTVLTVAHVPTSSGLVEPVVEIGVIAGRYNATYILDATQSVGQLESDVSAIGCHVLVTTGRKFLRAPRGTGFAYVSEELCRTLLPLAPDVRGAHWTSLMDWDLDASARRFESWEAYIAGRLGLGTAIDEAIGRGIRETDLWMRKTGAVVRESLESITGVTIVDPEGADSAIITFAIDGVKPADAVRGLAERGLRVVSVPATHGQWDLGDRGVSSVIRASAHVYNDDADLALLAEGVGEIAAGKLAGSAA